MQDRGFGVKTLILGSFVAVFGQLAAHPASASPTHPHAQSTAIGHPMVRHVVGHSLHVLAHPKVAFRGRRYAYGGISCVPFARSNSGISVSGNAWQWWDNAAGVYQRGSVPAAGSVLAFRANGRMHLGHVAVVTNVINAREIEVEHANWWGPGMHGGIARNIPVVDVSDNNDWTAVRVGLGQSGEFGSVYPTYGFIYDRPDSGVMVASRGAPAPQPELNPAPADLRPAVERGWQAYEEVAEAPAVPRHHRFPVRVAWHHVQRVVYHRPQQ